MRVRNVLVLCGLASVLAAHGLLVPGNGGQAMAAGAEAKATTPAEMNWSAQGGLGCRAWSM